MTSPPGGGAATDNSPPEGAAATDTPESRAVACAPITGTSAFGVRLTGSGPATPAYGDGAASGRVEATADVYFPNGRVPGAEVVLVQSSFERVSVAHGVLDDTLSARGLAVSDSFCGNRLQGDLIGPSGGFAGQAFENRSGPNTDAVSVYVAPVAMCAAGAVPDQKLLNAPPAVTEPYAQLQIRSARPFAPASLATVTAKTASGAVALSVTDAEPGAFVAVSNYGRFSFVEPTEVDLSGLRDVLGASLGLGRITLTVPTTVVTDLGFETPLPAGAWIGDAPTVEVGTLRLGNHQGWATAVAIGSSGGKTRARLRHRVDCGTTSSAQINTSIVSADGKSVPLHARCSETAVGETVDLPGVGPYTLFASHTQGTFRPCVYPPFSGVPGAPYVIDEIAFE